MTILSNVLTPRVHIENGKAITTSQAVADYFGKLHYNVLRDIESLDCSPQFTKLNFEVCFEINKLQNGKRQPYYQMTKDGFTFLVMGFTGKKAAQFKEAYIAEFNRIEKALNTKQPEKLPPNIYRMKSKYNPYRAYVWDGRKSIYIGCFPTVDTAGIAQTEFKAKMSEKLPIGICRSGSAKNPYRVQVWHNGTNVHLGQHATVKEAVDVRARFLAGLNKPVEKELSLPIDLSKIDYSVYNAVNGIIGLGEILQSGKTGDNPEEAIPRIGGLLILVGQTLSKQLNL